MEMFSVSAVIPVYNEEMYLHCTFQSINHVLNNNFKDFEIIFIDDGSKDNSFRILSEYAMRYQYVKVLQNYRHQGLGVTLNKGFSAAAKEIIFYIDCDMPFEPSFLIETVAFLDKYDIVIGRRDRWDSLLRKICSYCYNFIIRTLFRTYVSDINIGIKVLKRKIMDKMILHSRSAFIDAEIIIGAERQGFSIKEFPCIYKERLYGRSKCYNIGSVLLTIWEILNYYFRTRVVLRRKNSVRDTT